ncbi:MAG TPA: hypothetical protein DF783_00785 [Acidimicrobiaceae bacterium]|nr:hypothetical protein [Acidimicrobiaceae bacterium]
MTPERTCIGCRQRSLVFDPARIYWSDVTRGPMVGSHGLGRGAWLHADFRCAALVRPEVLSKALRRSVSTVQTDALIANWPTMVRRRHLPEG